MNTLPPPIQTVDNQSFWIAIQTFYAQEPKVSDYLDDYQTKHFIPTLTSVTTDEEGNPKRTTRAAVHNLLFLQIDRNVEELKSIITNCPYPISVYRQYDKPGEWCLIPDCEMLDLRLICDITFTEPVFVSARECEMKVGSLVRVTHGPLKGIEGKLVRKNKKYYLVRTFCDLGVMVSVSRWCCEKVGE